MNVIARLDFELAYNGVEVQHVSHYAAEIPFQIRQGYNVS